MPFPMGAESLMSQDELAEPSKTATVDVVPLESSDDQASARRASGSESD
jgi:hypothetical protein